MATSSTSSSEPIKLFWRSKGLAIVALALLLVVGVDRLLLSLRDSEVSANFADRLFVQPPHDGVYLLGNSMFKTGIDPDLMQRYMGNIGAVEFEYHNGHYTNLWYLIAKSALGRTAANPRVVVWGFRPRFAGYPAFRQNAYNEVDLFAFEDELFDALSAGQDFSDPDTLSAANVRSELSARSGIYKERETLRHELADRSVRLGIDFLELLGVSFAEELETSIIDGDRTLADEITRLVTDGDVVLTEELVIDDSGKFINGPRKPFSGGFLPATAQAISDSGLDQLVVIWKPILAANETPDPEAELFVREAITWFQTNSVPYLDLYHDSRIGPEHYGAGDHYNEDGRRLITRIVADTVRDMFYGAK